ncbi:AAA family ATPase [Desulfosarcina sp. OttesenSCG-928-A07]|nr:AAA family ATPase [Desulfosarcina sp. OttesenSCG-928-G17]MDL2328750.1 AAA family ATPase [Desulfosarcina sp. OttesenSCG-928-A07]
MALSLFPEKDAAMERLRGVVDRVTYHNADNGWSVLRVSPAGASNLQETVVVHQTRVFAGATMEFFGAWTMNPRYGRQFKAVRAVELRPATGAALEKYLGSGLIKGVGPKTAGKIVRHFGDQTLSVFESEIHRLTEVPGIARKKLAMIQSAWVEHRAIRDVMMFLQSHGISTLFAVRIYKEYGDDAISRVTTDPYALARDFYGIGFFSADRIALSLGVETDSPQRIMAGIRHVLAASREFGHCYLTEDQIQAQVGTLLEMDVGERVPDLLGAMETSGQLMVRIRNTVEGLSRCFYSRTLYFDEKTVAQAISARTGTVPLDMDRVEQWIRAHCRSRNIDLSDEQALAVRGIAGREFSVLTGGPGVGKTTTTRVLVQLLGAMSRKVLLAAPTGRAAQRMTEVIGKASRTLHRLLVWQGSGFKKNEKNQLDADFLIVDECSMLDISLTAALFKAIPTHCQVLLIGDADQLPSVGAGNVLHDIIAAEKVTCFRLTQIFRQAAQSLIIRYAHQINQGELPYMESPFKKPEIWTHGADCFFMDSDEATREQLGFVSRVKRFFDPRTLADSSAHDANLPETHENPYEFRVGEEISPYGTELVIPKKFAHVDIDRVLEAEDRVQELVAVVKRIHPWSSLHYGFAATDIVQKLYLTWIPKYYGNSCEIQVLSPMTRGSLGTLNLNLLIQESANPSVPGKAELKVGERIFRVGDRVIHRRNNYDLEVFNGDIGQVVHIDNEAFGCTVAFFPDHRQVTYQRDDLVQLDLAYAITIHKSQGSEFDAVIIPVLPQHFKMLFRNLLYTALTRAKKLAVLVGSRQAMAMAVGNQDVSSRQTLLKELLEHREV